MLSITNMSKQISVYLLKYLSSNMRNINFKKIIRILYLFNLPCCILREFLFDSSVKDNLEMSSAPAQLLEIPGAIFSRLLFRKQTA